MFSGNFGYSQLLFFAPREDISQKTPGIPKTFSWMTGPGIYHGKIDYSDHSRKDSVTVSTKLLPYPEVNINHPMGIAVTEFHVLILYPDKLQAICTLNEQLIFEDTFSDRFGKLHGLAQDSLKGSIWAYTDQAVFKYKIVREDRDVWRMYLSSGDFELAKAYSKSNLVNYDKVLTSQAEYLFDQKSYQESAKYYAMTQASFEEIALKFIQMEEQDALKTFLLKKLSTLKPVEATQTTLLVTWIVEIYLNQLGQLREQNLSNSQDYHILQNDFREFLSQPKVKTCVSLNRGTLYGLISSHGDSDNLLFFASLMEDHERVIQYHIQHKAYLEALDILNRQNKVDLFYRFSPELMEFIPKQMVDAWIAQGKHLVPSKLIPALVQSEYEVNPKQGKEAVRYFHSCFNLF